METIKDIVEQMREFADVDSQSIGRDVLRRRIQHFAYRIEAAWEIQLAAQKARAAGEGYAAGKQSVTNSNQFKMRETIAETEKRIDKVISILTEIPDNCGYGGLLEDAADELCDLKEEFVKPALAEPPRNCDLFGNSQEALVVIHNDRGYVRNPIEERRLTVDWLLAEAKGEAE